MINSEDMPPNMQKIHDLLQQVKQANVAELHERSGLSESTVRRILLELERRRLIIRYHGGAYVPQQNGAEPPVLRRTLENPVEKDLIAQEAAGRAAPGDCILLTGGSTVASMCVYLRDVPGLTVVTDSILVVQELMYSSAVELIVLGGVLNTKEQCVEGIFATNNLKQIRFGKMFHGIKSISARDGFLTDDIRQVEFYRECASLANELFILAASRKFFQDGVITQFSLSEVDCLITDSDAPPEITAKLEEQGCRIRMVGPPRS